MCTEKIKILVTTLTLNLICFLTFGQTPNNQDCAGAIPVCQATYSQTNSYVGVGNIPGEITGSLSCLSGEVNGVWYTFTVQQSGNLCFSITPNVLSEDYDWAVYNLTNNNCSDIATMASLDVSCNFSGASGVTGANGLGGSQNNPCIPMQAGQTYVLYVSNWSNSPNGYTLNLAANGGTAVIFDNVSPTISNIQDFNLCAPLASIPVNFSENVLCSSVSAADFQLISTTNGQTYSFSSASSILCNQGASYDNSFVFNLSNPINQTDTFAFCIVNPNTVDLCGNPIAIMCDTFIVNITNNITVNFVIQDVTCFNTNNGSANANAVNGVAPYTYQWATTPIQMGPNANNLAAGQYTVNITDGNGCGSQGIAIVGNVSTPIIENTSVVNTTCGLDNGSATINVNGGFQPYNYQINGNPTPNQIQNLAPGTYNITVSDSVNCTINSSFTVNASALPDIQIITKDSNDVVCFNDSIILRAFGGQSYKWYPNINLSDTVGYEVIARPTAKTTYYVEGMIPGGCTNIDSVTIKPNSTVDVISNILVTCPPDTITFFNSGSNLSNCNWYINGTQTSTICGNIDIPFIQSGFNQVSFDAQDIDGCEITSNVHSVDIRPLPFASFYPSPSDYTTIFDPVISFVNNSSLSSITYEWSIGDSVFSNDFDPQYFFTDTGLYEVRLVVTSVDGCKDTTYRDVYVDTDLILYIPTAFTPNGDGINDYFFVHGENMEEYNFDLKIFNRWGNIVYQSDKYFEKWDGTFRNDGNKMPFGIYSWKLELSKLGTKNQYSGTVTIYNTK
jgi:gliding motility-associated-like protein